MSYFSRRGWVTALVVLVLLNLASLAALWWGPPGRRGPHPRQAAGFIERELEFDAEQRRAYAELVRRHRRQTREALDRFHAARRSLFSDLGADSVDVAAATRAIGAGQARLEEINFEHFLQVRRLCRPDQEERFDRVIDEALRMMARPGPPP